MPEDTTTDNGGEIPLRGESAAMLFVGQERDRQRQPTPGQHGHQTLVAQRTAEAVERQGGERVEHGAPRQTEAAVRGQQRITGHLRWHLAVAQDEVRQDGERSFTRRALDTPDSEPVQTDPVVMRVACQASASTAGRLVFQLQAEGCDNGEDTFEERLPIVYRSSENALEIQGWRP